MGGGGEESSFLIFFYQNFFFWKLHMSEDEIIWQFSYKKQIDKRITTCTIVFGHCIFSFLEFF